MNSEEEALKVALTAMRAATTAADAATTAVNAATSVVAALNAAKVSLKTANSYSGVWQQVDLITVPECPRAVKRRRNSSRVRG